MANLTRLSVLVAEGDDDLNRDIAELLASLGVKDVVRVFDLAPALEWLRSRAFDILISAERLGDADGVELVRVARQASPATRSFLLRAEERAGVPMPEDVEVLELPVSAPKLRSLLNSAAAPQGGLWCEVPELSLSDILQMYHQGRRSITVLLSGPIAGRIRLDTGEIVDAQTESLRGISALSRLLEAESGLVRTETVVHDPTHTISAPFQRVILEAAQRLDEQRRDSQGVALPMSIENVSSEQLRLDDNPELVSPEFRAYAPNPQSFLRPESKPRSRKSVVIAASVLSALVLMSAVGVYFRGRVGASTGVKADARAAQSSLPGQPPSDRAEHDPAQQVHAERPLEQSVHALTPPGGPEAPRGPGAPAPEAPRGALDAPRAAPDPAPSFTLTISSTPSRATVVERGKVLGKTPLRLSIDNASVARAPRQFVLLVNGYLPYTLSQAASKADVKAILVLSPRPMEANIPDENAQDSDVEQAGARSNKPRAKRQDLGIRLRR